MNIHTREGEMAVTRDEVVDLASRGGAVEHIGRCSREWNRAGCDGAGIQVSVNIWDKRRGAGTYQDSP